MPRRTTIFSINCYYHIYNRSVSNNPLFYEDSNYSFFITKLKIYVLETANIIAYCLMPNHYHLLLQLTNQDLSKSMGQLAMSYTKSANTYYKRAGHLFQGRYKSKQIEDDNYLVYLSRYIHLNPFSSGLVKKPEDWKFSSYREFIGIDKVDFINPDNILDLFGGSSKLSTKEKQQMYKDYIEDRFII